LTRPMRKCKEALEAARGKISRLAGSPLCAVAQKLGRDLEEAECAWRVGSSSPDSVSELCWSVSDVIDGLPQSFGQRFFFDAAMIRAMAADWAGSMSLSPMVIPSYDRAWGHRSVQMPPENRQQAHLIDLILFPGDDRLEHVDLLAYPWVAHELGHYVVFQDDSPFRDVFIPSLEKRLRSLVLSAIADRGAARVKAQGVIDELSTFWTPSPDHKNWAHELAIDVIALWTCGPAYLASFQDEVERPQTNPYEITQDHPPYEVRLGALLDASRDVGFYDYGEGLLAVRKGWGKSRWRSARDNRFATLADRALAGECVRAAFRFCESMKLTKWTTARLDVCRKRLDDEASLELGVDLLLSARMVFNEQGEPAFDDWERKTVRRLAQETMQLSR